VGLLLTHYARPHTEILTVPFPRVEGYRTELPQDILKAEFTENSRLQLDPGLVGASETKNSGIIGPTVDLTLEHLASERMSTILFKLTNHVMNRFLAEPGMPPPTHLFHPLKRIVRQWMDEYLTCVGQTYPAQVLYQVIADMAGQRIHAALVRATLETGKVKVILDAYNREGSSRHVNFITSKPRVETQPDKCHVNYCVLDSDWEGEFCRVVEEHPNVLAYVKNHAMGFEVPYNFMGEVRRYRPDFIVKVDDGNGPDDPLNLVVEVKGYRGEDAKEKASTMDTYWVPGVNNLGRHGRWAFAEFTNVWTMQTELEVVVQQWLDAVIAAPEHELA